LIVVLLLANRIEGGVAAYQWAYTFFYLPHALFGVPIFNVLFTAMAEHVAREENDSVATRLGDGLRMLFFILAPIAVALIALAGPLTRVTLEYGLMSTAGAALVGRVLIAFAIGLPAYSVFLVLTRAFYALSDTKTPALLNALTVGISSAAGAVLFFVLPDDWSVAGLALGHSLAFAAGALLLGRMLLRRLGARLGVPTVASIRRSLTGAVAAGGVMVLTRVMFEDGGKFLALATVLLVGGLGATTYLLLMARLRSSELETLTALVRSAVHRR
jgi:putative peptidoglycan lipid II flippase